MQWLPATDHDQFFTHSLISRTCDCGSFNVKVGQHLEKIDDAHHLTAFARAFKNLSSTTRLAVGAGILAWGGIGLYLSDKAEERYGFTPTEKDKAELDKFTPKIVAVDKPTEKS